MDYRSIDVGHQHSNFELSDLAADKVILRPYLRPMKAFTPNNNDLTKSILLRNHYLQRGLWDPYRDKMNTA
jgi:hypothetical protein